MTFKSVVKTFLKRTLYVGTVLFLVIILCNAWVVYSTRDQVYSSVKDIPRNDVGLVLGTSKYSRSGRKNIFFHRRMSAAVLLYKERKVKHFILSGDNSSSQYYNEPRDMQNALMASGIPKEAITKDRRGVRTFDSVVRSKTVFGQDSLTIITQRFHTYRALFICKYYGIHAIAFAPENSDVAYPWTIITREYFARCKAVLDLYILRKEPEYREQMIPVIIEAEDVM